jgi:hypothetical protein
MLKAIKVLLLFFVIFLLLVFFSLFFGIKINSFSFGNISISQFYIKLDKKLILSVEDVILNNKKTNTESTFEEIKKDIQLLPNILKYFQKIDIENFEVQNNRFTINLEDNYLYLDNKYINLATSFEHSFIGNTNLDLYSLYFKNEDILVDGKIDISYALNKIHYKGKFFLEDIIGDLNINATKEDIEFALKTNKFKNLHFLKPYLKDMDSVAKAWTYDNVKGSIKVKNFTGKYDLIKNKLDENSLIGEAVISDASIKFNKKVEAIKTKKIDISFKNNNLKFELDTPTFRGIALNGSNVLIENIASQKNGVVIVEIKTKHILDNNIQDILKAFNVNIPLIQKSGQTNAQLKLFIPYVNPMETYGRFEIKDSNVSINNSFDLYSKSAIVTLEKNIVKISKADFKHDDMIDANINMEINTDTLKASGDASINSILIKPDEEIINIKDTKSKLQLDFNDDVNIDLLDLNAYLTINEYINIDLTDLSKLVNYSSILSKNNISSGKLFLKVKDYKNIEFKASVFGENLQIYSKNIYDAKKIKNLNIDGEIISNVVLSNVENVILENESTIYNVSSADVQIKEGNAYFNARVYDLDIPLLKDNEKVKALDIIGVLSKSNDIKIDTVDNTIRYKNLSNQEYIDVYLNGYDVQINTNDDSSKNNAYDKEKYVLKAVNSNLIINDKFKFLAKNIDAKLDENVVLDLNYNSVKIRFEDKNKQNKIFAENLNDSYLNTMIGKNIFSGGIMNVSITGKNYELEGDIELLNSRIKDLAFINNLITFVNTTPALINPLLAIPSVVDILSNDGFNLNGYRINEGNVNFKYSPINDKILVKELSTIGNSVDFEGSGIVDLKTDTLDMNMNLIFLKGYSNIVKHLPVVNYLLLGKNNRVETSVRILGNIDDPKVETNFLKEGINAPLDFGKRIINTPKNLYDSVLGNDD